MAGFLDPELVRAVCRAPPPSKETKRKKPVDERGLTPAMRELVDSKPRNPTSLPSLEAIVGSRVQLVGLVGTERNWNGRRGTVTAKHLSLHPENKNVRAWVLEISFDKHMTKTTFFSDHCRLIDEELSLSVGGGRNGVSKNKKKIKPNQQCPCGSGKKFKKCCSKKFPSGYYTAELQGPNALPLTGNDAGRSPLRFKPGDLVQAFAGAGEWINGKVIKNWDQGNPYRIELDDSMFPFVGWMFDCVCVCCISTIFSFTCQILHILL